MWARVCVCVCALWLPILPGGERLSSSLDSKVRGMTDFFFPLPSSNSDLSPQSPVSSLHSREIGVKRRGWGVEGDRKRGLTSLIKSMLVCVPSVGISRGGWRRRRRWSGCERNAVQPGADVGVEKREKKGRQWGFLDVFSDGAFTFCSPLLLKIPTTPHLSPCSCPQPLFHGKKKKKDATISKTVFQTDPTWQTQTVPLATGTVDRSFPSVPFVYTSVCV